MRLLKTTLAFVLVTGLTACNSGNREKIKADARNLRSRVDAAVQPDSQSAREKLSGAEATARRDAARAGIDADRAALTAQVKAKLAADAGLNTVTGVSVDTNGSTVTLTGTVASEDQRKAAQTAASQVPGVTEVHNQLTVRQ